MPQNKLHFFTPRTRQPVTPRSLTEIEEEIIHSAAKILNLSASELKYFVSEHKNDVPLNCRINSWVIPGIKTLTGVEQTVISYAARQLNVNVKLIFKAALHYHPVKKKDNLSFTSPARQVHFQDEGADYSVGNGSKHGCN